MKRHLIVISTILIAVSARAQVTFNPDYGGPAYAPAGSAVTYHTVAQIWIEPRTGIYSMDFSADTTVPGVKVDPPGFGADNWGTTNVDLTVKIHSDVPECYPYYGITFNGTVQSSRGSGSTSAFYSFGPVVFYDTNIIGIAEALNLTDTSNIVSFQNTEVGGSSNAEFHVIVDSPLARYRAFTALNLRMPFYLKDSIPIDYGCQTHISSTIEFRPEVPGKYIDTAYILDPLTNDSLPLVLVGTAYDAGISPEQTKGALRVCPNPAWNEIQIIGCQRSEVRLYDLLGREVIDRKIEATDGVLNVSSLTPGTYALRVGTQTAKVIIAR